MNKLQAALNVVVANTFVMAFKAQSFHWNVEGKRFHMIHNFLQEIYEDLFDSVDDLAENLRFLDSYGPSSIAELLKYSTIEEETKVVSDCTLIMEYLIEANEEVINSLNACFSEAEEQNEQGLVDLLGARIAVHKKFGWMLKSTNKEE